MKIAFSAPAEPNSGVLVVGVLADRKLTDSAKALDKRMKGALVRAVKGGRFKGARDQSLALPAPAGTKLDLVLVVGLGKAAELDAGRLQALGGGIYAALAGRGPGAAAVAVDGLAGCKLTPAGMAAEIAFGARLRSYRFDKYRTKVPKDEKPSLKTLTFHCDGPGKARNEIGRAHV